MITHGGNNTTTETFARGKPMLVLPLFADQFDNAQRLEETCFGSYLDPYQFTESQLVATLDRLLEDEQLHKRLNQAASRIQLSNKHQQLCESIETILSNM